MMCVMDDTVYFVFFNDTATTEIYTLSLHDALPIWAAEQILRIGAQLVAEVGRRHVGGVEANAVGVGGDDLLPPEADRKSTRLNSSHANISYAVFCLKKKKNQLIRSIHNTETNY